MQIKSNVFRRCKTCASIAKIHDNQLVRPMDRILCIVICDAVNINEYNQSTGKKSEKKHNDMLAV